jgi:hypothetical protein
MKAIRQTRMDLNTAMLCDSTGRHLVMMPHSSTFQWNWALPKDRNDEFLLGMKPL